MIIDGVIGMESQGPWNGDPIRSNMLVTGYDLVATDVVAAHLMGYVPEEIPLVHYAAQAGLGNLDFQGTELVGDDFEDLKVEFKRCVGFDSWVEKWLSERG